VSTFAFLMLMTVADADAARVAVDKYAACLVESKGYRIRPLLDQPIGDKGEPQRWLKVINADCLFENTVSKRSDGEATIRFSPNVIRGAVFESFLRKDYSKLPKVQSFDDVGPVKYASQAKDASTAEAAYALSMDMGECTVRKATESSHALLATSVGTKAEMVATEALLPTIESCTQSGVTLKFSLSIIRGMIAEPMYRLTKAKLGEGEN
jgi:hypothetical protein